MVTIGQFKLVWDHFSRTYCAGFPHEAHGKIKPLFEEFAIEFYKQFGDLVQFVDKMPQSREITGPALEKLKAWVEYISQYVEEDYIGWCGFRSVGPLEGFVA